jgi:hypothetical protein
MVGDYVILTHLGLGYTLQILNWRTSSLTKHSTSALALKSWMISLDFLPTSSQAAESVEASSTSPRKQTFCF